MGDYLPNTTGLDDVIYRTACELGRRTAIMELIEIRLSHLLAGLPETKPCAVCKRPHIELNEAALCDECETDFRWCKECKRVTEDLTENGEVCEDCARESYLARRAR